MGLDALLQKRLANAGHSEAFELGVHLVAEPGITVLLGPSGSGKTLTMNCIGGFVKPDTGRILLDNEILFDAAAKVNLTPEQRHCGYIFQDHALFPHMTIRDNLQFAAQAAPREQRSGLHRRKQMAALLEAFELTELAGRKPAQLSGGQRQRAALARIFVSAPRLLLLDEPTRGLDRRLREAFYQLLEDTQKRLQIPVILITHDVEECLRLADFICLTEKGRFLSCGTREETVEVPTTVAVARAIGIFNLLPAEIVALDPGRRTSVLRIAGAAEAGEIAGPYLRGHLLGDRGTLCFRESEVDLSSPDNATPGSGLWAKAISANLTAGGVRLQLGLVEDDRVPVKHPIYVTVRQSEWEELRQCERIRLSIPVRALSFLG